MERTSSTTYTQIVTHRNNHHGSTKRRETCHTGKGERYELHTKSLEAGGHHWDCMMEGYDRPPAITQGNSEKICPNLTQKPANQQLRLRFDNTCLVPQCNWIFSNNECFVKFWVYLGQPKFEWGKIWGENSSNAAHIPCIHESASTGLPRKRR